MKSQKKRNRPTSKKRRSKRRFRKTRNQAPQTSKQYFSKSKQFQEIWDSVAQVISKMRSGNVSLPKAAREFGVKPNEVIALGGSALKKKKNGRYAARKTDRLLRVLIVLTVKGKLKIALRDSRLASVIGSHWHAVQRYLQTGDDSGLRKFQGKKITDARGKRHRLLTDLDELNRLGSAGVLSFESLYGRSA